MKCLRGQSPKIMGLHNLIIEPHDSIRYSDVIMGAMASQITGRTIVYSTVQGADQRKYQSSASLAFVRGIHRWPVNSPHKGPVTRKMFPFDDVITFYIIYFVVGTSRISLIGPAGPVSISDKTFIVRSHEDLKLRDWWFKLSQCFEIWKAHWQ